MTTKNCYNCSNYNKETGYCRCITYNICGITVPDCFPNGCKYHNVTVLVPMVNCMDDTTITTENYKKCIGCVHDCIRKGKDLMEESKYETGRF